MARKDFRMWWAGLVVMLALGFGMRGETATHPSFSGTWELAPARSTNLGMMSAVKLTLVIVQTSNALAIKETSVFQGKASDRVVGYDLTGRPVTNRAPLGGASETVAHWEEDKLVVTWKTEGIAGGPPIVRTETRSLEPDGRTMRVEMSLGEGPSVIMVFERKK